MTDLPTRLEGAAAGSRELDAEVWACVNGYELFEHDGAGWRYRMKPDDIMRHERTGFISPVTTSLDAAVALAERVLGDREVSMAQRKPRHMETCGEWWNASLFKVRTGVVFGAGPDTVTAKAATPALALCAAIIRAHAEQVQG